MKWDHVCTASVRPPVVVVPCVIYLSILFSGMVYMLHTALGNTHAYVTQVVGCRTCLCDSICCVS